MFLPQVVKSARARDEEGRRLLLPFIEAEKARTGDVGRSNGCKIVMATVKGERARHRQEHRRRRARHNNFDVVDLGVMVPAQKIPRHRDCGAGQYDRAVGPHHAHQLEEMSHVARNAAPGFLDSAADPGATTSLLTALKIDPHYKSPTVVGEGRASRAVGVSAIADLRRSSSTTSWRRSAPKIRRDPRAPQKDRSGAKRLVPLDKGARAALRRWLEPTMFRRHRAHRD